MTLHFGGAFGGEEVQVRLNRELAPMKARSLQYWPIFLSDGEHVGCCGRPYGTDGAPPALGFHLDPKFGGQGLAVETARAVIQHAFEVIGAKGLAAEHHPDNANSKKVMAKLGFPYTYDKFFAGLGMNIPYYLLTWPR